MKKFLIVLTICVLPILAYSDFSPVVRETMVSPPSVLGTPIEEEVDGGTAGAGSTPVATSPLIPVKPILSISEALGVAENYLKARGTDISGQCVHSVRLCYDEGDEVRGEYWHVQWAWSLPRMDGEYGVRIYMDGTVIPDLLDP